METSSPPSPSRDALIPVPDSRDVAGLPVAVTDYAGAVGVAFAWARSGDTVRLIEAANAHVVALAATDRAFGDAMAAFDLILPDGMPLVWALNRSGGQRKLRDRVYGPTFMLECLKRSENEPIRHFLLGGTLEQLEGLEANFGERFPGAALAGSYSPPFGGWTEEVDQEIFRRIARAKANVVWVGLGCPKQELWMAKNKERLPAAVYMGIGAAFAFHSGSVAQAPALLQKLGLEWLFRLVAEPRRLWKRYFKYNSLFVLLVARQAVRAALGRHGGRG